MHLADTEEQARRDCEFGLAEWIRYFQEVAALPLVPETKDHASLVDAMNASGVAVIGTPEMAVRQLERLIKQSGGFGTYLFMAHEWADPPATNKSYELFARDVMPVFQGSAERTVGSRDWASTNRPEFLTHSVGAVDKAIADHKAEQEALAASQGSPSQG
jgi:limonene 1,2-monooxygenase